MPLNLVLAKIKVHFLKNYSTNELEASNCEVFKHHATRVVRRILRL